MKFGQSQGAFNSKLQFFCNLLTQEALRSSSERIRVFQMELEFGSVGL